MNRKNWSNFFILIGALNVALGFLPNNPVRIVDWIAIPLFLAMGIMARRKMI